MTRPGSDAPIPDTVFKDTLRWLEIEVDGETLSPRSQLVAVPFSYRVGSIEGALGGNVYGDLTLHSVLRIGDNSADTGRIEVTNGDTSTISMDGAIGLIHATGEIHSTGGGFRFPDGTVQTTASTSANAQWISSDSVLFTTRYVGIARGGAANFLLGDSAHTHVNFGVASTTDSAFSTIGGGIQNEASGNYATVGGGTVNAARDGGAVVSGGIGNRAYGAGVSICGGRNNVVFYDSGAVIGGGVENETDGASYGVIAGGYQNWIGYGSQYAVIGGGSHNTTTCQFGTIGGGESNVLARHSTLHMGRNSALPDRQADLASSLEPNHSTIAGGKGNSAYLGSCIGGGSGNVGMGYWGVIAGGYSNRISFSPYFSPHAAIGGGRFNSASGPSGTISGGDSNRVDGSCGTIGGGSHNLSSGSYAVVPGGQMNHGAGGYSFAAGRRAKADHPGAFVWADSTDADYHSQRANQFVTRATGGVRHDVNNGGWMECYADGTDLIKTSTGAHLTLGGDWANLSDAALKEHYVDVDGADVLDRLSQLRITRWNYRVESDKIQHIGPTAQDFRALFGLGSDDKTISTVDPAGVALAAIQELYRQNRELSVQNDALQRRLEALERRVSGID